MMITRRLVSFALLSLAIISLVNHPKVSLAIMLMSNDNDYKRGNYHFSGTKGSHFSMWSVKGYDDVVDAFNDHKKMYPGDTILCRNFKPDYRKIYRWYAYATDPQFQLSYRFMTREEMLINTSHPKY